MLSRPTGKESRAEHGVRLLLNRLVDLAVHVFSGHKRAARGGSLAALLNEQPLLTHSSLRCATNRLRKRERQSNRRSKDTPLRAEHVEVHDTKVLPGPLVRIRRCASEAHNRGSERIKGERGRVFAGLGWWRGVEGNETSEERRQDERWERPVEEDLPECEGLEGAHWGVDERHIRGGRERDLWGNVRWKI